MTTAFSNTEPYEKGFLDTGDRNRIYYEVRGNPKGKPALIVHGGPGAGSPTGTPKAFDAEKWRIILFDQRGCGRSTPNASDVTTDMSLNTTHHLIRDMEQLREHLSVEKWFLFGGSWGSGLSIAYAEQYPHRVSEMVVASIWTMSTAEIDWLYRGGVGVLFPEEWETFCAAVSSQQQSGDIVATYANVMDGTDEAARTHAALAWCAWEDAVLSLEPNGKPRPFSSRPSEAQMAFVRICSHYAAAAAWLDDGALLANAGALDGIPGVIIHGRLDLSCPAQTAWKLSHAWLDSELVLVADAGHKGSTASNDHLHDALRQSSE